MRVILAAIFVFASMLAMVGWLSTQYPDGTLPWWTMLLAGLAFLASIPLAVFLFNTGFIRRLKGQSDRDYLNELLAKGEAVAENYTVHAAISFEDLSTGSQVHLLDIGNDKVLCLYGQYLYDHEPIDDDPEINQDRKFPTRQFSVVRRLKDAEILVLAPGAEVVEPRRLENPDVKPLHDLGFKLQDGEIVEIPFEKLQTLQSRKMPRRR